MRVIHAALMLKTATRRQHAQRNGARPLILMHSLVRMHKDISHRDMTRAPRGCTKRYFLVAGHSDGEGQRMTVWHINLKI